jgi:hypothetical protein
VCERERERERETERERGDRETQRERERRNRDTVFLLADILLLFSAWALLCASVQKQAGRVAKKEQFSSLMGKIDKTF